jgi:hypothetical protein
MLNLIRSTCFTIVTRETFIANAVFEIGAEALGIAGRLVAYCALI